MDRVEYLLGYSRPYGSLYCGFVQALSPAEACAVFLALKGAKGGKRPYVLKRVAEDAGLTFEPCHEAMVQHLTHVLQHGNYQERVSAANAASCIACHPTVPTDVRLVLAAALLKSPYVPVRRYGYELLRLDSPEEYKALLHQAWEQRRDPAAVRYLIELMEPEFLLQHVPEIISAAPRQGDVTRLLIKIAPLDRGPLLELRAADPITYVYVLTKLGEAMPPAEALRIFQEVADDERIGLLLWCFGKMKLWDVLVRIATEAGNTSPGLGFAL